MDDDSEQIAVGRILEVLSGFSPARTERVLRRALAEAGLVENSESKQDLLFDPLTGQLLVKGADHEANTGLDPADEDDSTQLEAAAMAREGFYGGLDILQAVGMVLSAAGGTTLALGVLKA